ncbi:hypothetical protein L218DRAFT_997873 [Marasmius fiardii PR-910]|nr:hypothetical protein L218DRAFT_997873 [Marasmius fiardii PR-910]
MFNNDRPRSPVPAPFVEAIRAERLVGEEWGFQRWENSVERQMDPSNGVGIEEVRDSFRAWWIQDREALDGVGMDVVRDYFNRLPDVPQGMDHDMCLAVNAAFLESVLKDTTSSSESRRTKFLYAVDTEYGTHEEPEHRGYFRVSMDALLGELFPILLTRRQAPEELEPANEEQVWAGWVSI